MTRRVGLLGGTFDPPHLGHLVVAECARIELALDEVRFLVAGDPWMKATRTPAAHRVAMAVAAVAGDAHLVVDDREVARAGPTYTVDTLRELRDAEPTTAWYFLLGEDAAGGLGRWHRVDEALGLATFVVVTRPGAASGSDDHGFALARLSVPGIDVSSSDLRARFAAGAATRYLVPDAVGAYVRDHGLYGTADA